MRATSKPAKSVVWRSRPPLLRLCLQELAHKSSCTPESLHQLDEAVCRVDARERFVEFRHEALTIFTTSANCREYAERLKASRDELASAAATAEVSSTGLTNLEKQALLTQKASVERMTTETRR